MKGAILISVGEAFFEDVVESLVAEGADYTPGFGGQVQLRDGAGRMFMLYPWGSDDVYGYQEGPFFPAGPEVEVPDMRAVVACVVACVVECRWEDLFVSTVGRLAGNLRRPMWVLDDRSVVWDASAVDPARVAL
ncbi:hypothetical protein GCM10009804_36630 [Kribbella hippodromi]|uniref:Uncharacterized protein n=1 Tax=Kribbella hippodromi TaxID=434347 RepID=A0ABN2DFM1_9ACTN